MLATLVAVVIGITYGAIAGFFGGKTDLVMMRIVDVLYGLPFLFFVIMLTMVLGRGLPRSSWRSAPYSGSTSRSSRAARR